MRKKNTLGTGILEGLIRLHGLLPLQYHRFLARILAWLMRDVFRYRLDVVYTNLARSFPEKPYKEIKSIARQFYLHFTTIFAEMIWFGSCKGERGRRRLHKSHIVEVTNPEEFNRLFASKEQMMVLQTHAGNWELISGVNQYTYGEPLSLEPSQVSVAYVPLRSRFWDSFTANNRIAPIADQGFDGYIDFNHILRAVLSNRAKKMAYVFITDQYPYKHGAGDMKMEFMHQNTFTMSAAAGLAVKMDMSVVYLRFRTRPEGGYTMTFVPIEEHASGADPSDIMIRYYKLLEEDLELQPWNYLWTHKRWK
ncbi:MAG: lysophospholipid acyltransferase family protein [Bacteroidales bacterium]|nr:lysophospholipid acyltransferase family protein [Bacteroidales bacterium]